jgi:hypothetical protein
VAASVFVSVAVVAGDGGGVVLALGGVPEAGGAAGASPDEAEQVIIIASPGHDALIKSFLPLQCRLVS